VRFGFDPVDGTLHEFGSTTQLELIFDVCPVGLNGFDAEIELLCNFARGRRR